ncbi:MAG: DUF362 domain-containing protein [Bryobacteraceae bacterium]
MPDVFLYQSPKNSIVESLGLLFQQMGLDPLNPLGKILSPGQTVLIKPNLVTDRHEANGSLGCVVTDPMLVRALCDYIFLAVGKSGQVILGDAPELGADWTAVLRATGLDELPSHFGTLGYRVVLVDFRTVARVRGAGEKQRIQGLRGDPAGYRTVDLGAASLHAGRDWRRLRTPDGSRGALDGHHNATRHEYLIAGSLLTSDVVFNLSKLKTYPEMGLGSALANMTGICGAKDWLPHHMAGGADSGGDEYPAETAWTKVSQWVADHEAAATPGLPHAIWSAGGRLANRMRRHWDAQSVRRGLWHGNDTSWRTVVDLNRVALYADRNGILRHRPQRQIWTIVDAFVAGEGEGPTAPDPVDLRCLIASSDPLAADIAASRLAGWPLDGIRHISGAFSVGEFPLAEYGLNDVRMHPSPVPVADMGRRLRPSRGFEAIFDREAAHV